MKGINRIQWCSVVLLAFILTACKVKRPETVLPDAKMENVLYDYHIAKAMGEEVPYNESYKRVLYIESVVDGDLIHGSVMAGQIAGLVKDSRSCKEIIEGICQEMKEIILTQAEKIGR